MGRKREPLLAPCVKRPVIWVTGIPASGKTTLGRGLVADLRCSGIPADLVDGDEIREVISSGLGFSKEDRLQNGRRMSWIARLLARNGVVPVVAAVSPYKEGRAEARRDAGSEGLGFLEIYLECDVRIAQARDWKGTYNRRLVTGVDDPYEEPVSPDAVIKTGNLSEKESLTQLLSILRSNASF